MPSKGADGYQYEDDLAVEAAAYLDRVLPEDAVWWHTANQGHGLGRTPRALMDARKMAMKLKSMGMKSGIPDILILWQGRLYVTDAKSRTGNLTESQKEMLPKLERAGAAVKPTFRSLDELESHLTTWGIPLKFSYTQLKTKTVMKPSEAGAMSAIALASGPVKKRRERRAGAAFYAEPKPATRGA